MGIDEIFQLLTVFWFLILSILFFIAAASFLIYAVVKWILFPLVYYYRAKKIIYSEIPRDESTDHTAIIVILYSGRYFYKNAFVYLSGIEILTQGLKELGETYVLYRCFTKEKFFEIINKETAKRIWIIGHGFKHGVSFGKEKLYYCDVGENHKKSGCSPKEYVKQLHCNADGGKSLIDYVCNNKEKSFVTDDLRSWDENRKYIKETLEEMKKEKWDKKE